MVASCFDRLSKSEETRDFVPSPSENEVKTP